MPAQASPCRAARKRSAGHLGPTHPLAQIAQQLCRQRRHRGPRVGRTACGFCWEITIRDDELFIIAFGLDRDLPTEPVLVDEIAVELAVRGQRVRLTDEERAEVGRRLDRATGSAVAA